MRQLFCILIISCTLFADVEVYMWILPVKVYFNDQTVKQVWLETPENAQFYNPEYSDPKHPIPGKKVIFVNKLSGQDSLIISEKLYMMPDSFQVLIDKKIGYANVSVVEDISSDSLNPIGIWTSRRLSEAQGKVVLENKPVFVDTIVLEEDAAWNAEHVYCYDASFTKQKMRNLYKNGGRDNPTLKKALEENRIIMIFEATP